MFGSDLTIGSEFGLDGGFEVFDGQSDLFVVARWEWHRFLGRLGVEFTCALHKRKVLRYTRGWDKRESVTTTITDESDSATRFGLVGAAGPSTDGKSFNTTKFDGLLGLEATELH